VLLQSDDPSVGWAAGRWWKPVEGFRWCDGTVEPVNEDEKPYGSWLTVKNPSPDAKVDTYPVLRQPELLDRFINLQRYTPQETGVGFQPLQDAVLAFANDYGWLGHPSLVSSVRYWSRMNPILERTLGRPPTPIEPETPYPAESLMQLWEPEIHHIAALWHAHKMLAELESSGSHRARTYVEKTIRSAAQFGADGFIFHVPTPIWFLGDRVVDAADPASRLRSALEAALQRKLRGNINVVIEAGTLRYWPDGLLAAVYLHFAARLLNLASERRVCPYCHDEFAVRRKGQVFCSDRHRGLYHYHAKRPATT
jgi:hypothetical protein